MTQLKTKEIARLCHEVNRALCEASGDMSQKPWNEAEDWQRQSAIDGVSFAKDHPESTPEDQHVAWMKQKIIDGWVYGETKDAETKTHPCLVPYSDLPFAQRIKDYAFSAIVRTLTGNG